DKRDLLVGLGAVEHDPGGPELLAAVHDRHRGAELGEEGGLLHRGVPAPDDDDGLVLEEEAVAGGARAHPASEELLLARDTQVARGRARAVILATGAAARYSMR